MRGRGRRMPAMVMGGSLLVAVGLGVAVPAVAAPAAPAATAKAVTIAVHRTSVGKRIAARRGRTVYMFSIDTSKKSHCMRRCRKVWKPVISKKSPRAGSGVNRKRLARIGHHQVTYHGHPLYYYAGDTAAGQANGEGLFAFQGYWYTLTARGRLG